MTAAVEILEGRTMMSAAKHVAVPDLSNGWVAGQATSASLGTLLAAGPDAYHGKPVTVIVRWGDHTKSKIQASAYDGATGFPAVGEHTYAEAGQYKVKVSFRRGSRVVGHYATVATVARNSDGGADLSATAGQPFSGMIGSFAKWGFPAVNPTVDWGDGTTESIGLVDRGEAYAAVSTHTYAAPGSYQVSVYATNTYRPPPPGQPDIGAPATTLNVITSTITVLPAAP